MFVKGILVRGVRPLSWLLPRIQRLWAVKCGQVLKACTHPCPGRHCHRCNGRSLHSYCACTVLFLLDNVPTSPALLACSYGCGNFWLLAVSTQEWWISTPSLPNLSSGADLANLTSRGMKHVDIYTFYVSPHTPVHSPTSHIIISKYGPSVTAHRATARTCCRCCCHLRQTRSQTPRRCRCCRRCRPRQALQPAPHAASHSASVRGRAPATGHARWSRHHGKVAVWGAGARNMCEGKRHVGMREATMWEQGT